MSTIEITSKIEALKEWETVIEEAQAEAEALKDAIKAEMLKRDTEELEAGAYIIRWTSVLSNRFAFAEYERGMIVERTQMGKAAARQNPNFRDGRPKKYSSAQIALALDLLNDGKTYREVENMTGISKSTLVRAKKEVSKS